MLQRTPFVTFTVGYLFAVDVTECTFSYLYRQGCFVPFVTSRSKKKPGVTPAMCDGGLDILCDLDNFADYPAVSIDLNWLERRI